MVGAIPPVMGWCAAGGSVLDVEITGIDQRTALCIGSANEVDRFNEMLKLGA